MGDNRYNPPTDDDMYVVLFIILGVLALIGGAL